MIKLPRLTPLVQLVDPKTGLSTRQGADFWNQFATRIEAAFSSVQQGDVSVSDTLQIGDNLTLTPDGTLSATGEGLGINIANGQGVVVHDASELTLLGDVIITGRVGAEADAYFPPLQVDGFEIGGGPVAFSPVHDITTRGNAYLSSQGESIDDLGIVGSAIINAVTLENIDTGSGFIYFQYDYPAATPPWITLQEGSAAYGSIVDFHGSDNNGASIFFGTVNSSITSPIVFDIDDETDCIARILTTPCRLLNSFSGTLSSGTDAQTISLPVTSGKLYLAAIERPFSSSISASSSAPLSTLVGTIISAGTSAAYLWESDVTSNEILNITLSASSPGFGSIAGYIGILVTYNDPTSDHVTITVPPLTVWNGGTEVSTNLHSMSAGSGIILTGDANDATITSFLDIGGQQVEETLALGLGLSISGTSPEGLTLTNTGVLALSQGSAAAAGTINIGAGLSLSGTSSETLLNAGVLDLVQGSISLAGNITLGSAFTISGQTLNVSGGGGMMATVGSSPASYGTLVAGPQISFSGNAPNLTLNASGTLSGGIIIENQGASIGNAGTINVSSGLTASIDGDIAIFTSGGGGENAPAAAALGFTNWDNRGSANELDADLGMSFSGPNNGGHVLQALYKTAPSAPYAVHLEFIWGYASNTAAGVFCGWRSAAGEYDGILIQITAGVYHCTWANANSAVTFTNILAATTGQNFVVEMTDDGTNVTISCSSDGENFSTVYSGAKSAAYLGASGYNQIAIGTDGYNSPTNFIVTSYSD